MNSNWDKERPQQPLKTSKEKKEEKKFDETQTHIPQAQTRTLHMGRRHSNFLKRALKMLKR